MKRHDDAMIEMLRSDPDFAAEYMRTAFEEMDEEGGEAALLAVLRQLVEARGGMADVAKRAELSRESLYRALSPNGNPTLHTLRAVVHATGLSFAQLMHPA